jgi:glycosyltransferase involved in cell wall biosynthesis
MAPPRFSVVIPTRERAQTLLCTLQTCLDQEFEDYEVVVCDNHSSPATRQVVEGFASPRVRYVRAPGPLAMSHNWELAVEHAAGEYVTVLGDDDGLLRHALRELDGLIAHTQAKAIRWSAAFYLWPTVALEGEGNYLALPLSRELRTVDGATAISGVAGFSDCYTTLPMIYNSVIHRDLIAELRARTGCVFANNCPDIYSGFTFAYLAGTYQSVDVPMSVAGLSGNSTGVAALLLRRPSPVAHEFRRLNARAGLPLHPWVPDLPIFPAVPVADSFQYAREALFPHDEWLCLDRRGLAGHCVANLWARNADEWRDRLALIRATFADAPELRQWFDDEYGSTPFRETPPVRLRAPALGYDGGYLHLETDPFGVADVAGAARLCSNLLGFGSRDVSYDLPPHGRMIAELNRVGAEAARLAQAAQAAQAQLVACEAARGEEVRALHAQLAVERNSLGNRLQRAPGKLLRRLWAFRKGPRVGPTR